jgi:hypothetical protein
MSPLLLTFPLHPFPSVKDTLNLYVFVGMPAAVDTVSPIDFGVSLLDPVTVESPAKVKNPPAGGLPQAGVAFAVALNLIVHAVLLPTNAT